MKTEWQEVDASLFRDTSTTSKKKGIVFTVSLSPYDIPEKFRGYYCQSRKVFVFEFRYIISEPLFEERLSDAVVVFRGESSKRIHRIEADIVRMGAEDVGISFSPLAEALEKVRPKVANDALRTQPRKVADRALFNFSEQNLREQLMGRAEP